MAVDLGLVSDCNLGSTPSGMLREVTTRGRELPGSARHTRLRRHNPTPRNNEYLALQSGEVLFSQGDRRESFFRIDTGAIVVLAQDRNGEIISCSLREVGSYVGFGFRGEYMTSAHAIGDVTVAQFCNDELPECIEREPSLAPVRAAAIRQEYEIVREHQIAESADLTPLQRVARVLLALSEIAKHQGCNLRAISDLLESDYISGLVGISTDDLTQHVSILVDLGYLEISPTIGIEIADIDGLHAMSR